MSNNLCEQCRSTGLPIMLARYAVVPTPVAQNLPAWVSGNKVTSVPLGRDFKYVLRTLRAGYVYLFYGKGPRGKDYWECYAVGEDGSMLLQPSAEAAQPQATPTFVCSRNGHSNINVSFMVIPQPELCGPVWIAFSQHKWSPETLARYKTNKADRDQRMQTIQPPAMAGGAKHSHGQLASEAVLREIVEFAPRAGTKANLPHGGMPAAISKPDGSYDLTRLQKLSTRHPWFFADELAAQVLFRMIERGKTPGRPDIKPQVLALWDAVGVAHELNGFRSDAAGCIQQYAEEREMQIAAMNAIEGLKVALRERATAEAQQSSPFQAWQWTAEDSAKRLSNARNFMPGMLARNEDLCRRWEQDAQRGVPAHLARQRSLGLGMSEAEWLEHNRRIDQEISSYDRIDPRDGLSVNQRRERANNARIQQAVAEAWPKYEKKLKAGAQEAFRGKYEAFLDAAAQLVERRTEPLIRWLEAPLFIDTLEDFDPTSIADGVMFDYMVGESIFGIGSSRNGQAKLDEWIAQGSASTKGNLFWRAIALNYNDGIADVNAALKAAKEHAGTPLTELAATAVLANLKNMQRLADTYKKAQSVYTANSKALSDKGSSAFGVALKGINTRAVDASVISAGDRVFKALGLAKVGDVVAEKIIQHVLSLRAFVHVDDSIQLIKVQARTEGITTRQMLERIRTARTFMQISPVKSGAADELAAAWSKFRNTHADGPANFKDARLAVVVGLIEGLNFADLVRKSQGDDRSRAMIMASGLSIGAALFDVASAPAKSVFGSDSWSYQRFKFFGGILGGTASLIGSGVDFGDAYDNFDKNRYGLMSLYMMKGAAGLIGGGLTMATTFTYAAPLIQRLTGSAAVGTAARVVGARAAQVVATRILLMSAGAWITVGLVSIQVLIWIFADDALQYWCQDSAFGENNRFKSADEQKKALDTALLEVL